MNDLASINAAVELVTIVDDAALVKAAQHALLVTEDGIDHIHTRSTTGYQLTNFVLNHDSPTRQLRQISAELQRKRDALQEACSTLKKRTAKADYLFEQAEEAKQANSMARARYLEAQAEAERDTIPMLRRPITGCLRDIARLGELYEQVQATIIAKHGSCDEAALEAEEAHYWVKRLFRQSLRDMRASNHIQPGNQEALECIGLDPSSIETLCADWLKEQAQARRKFQAIDTVALEAFLEGCAERFAKAEQIRNEARNLTTPTNHLYLKPS